MASSGVFELIAYTALHAADVFAAVDTTDATQSPQGSLKKITAASVFAAATPITVAAGTVTVSTPVFQATETWNAGGTTFTAIDLNVTSTASASGSLLLNLRVGGTSQFKVDKAGAVTVTGVLTANSTTDASSSSTGGVIIAGGVGIAKKLYVGTVLDVGTTAHIAGAATLDSTLATGGVVGIGVSANAGTGALVVTGALTTGVTQFCGVFAPTFTSAATTYGRGVWISPTTAAAAYTMTSAYGLYVDNFGVGAGSAITTQYGVYIATQNNGGTNWDLYVAGARIYMKGLPTSSAGLPSGALWLNTNVLTIVP